MGGSVAIFDCWQKTPGAVCICLCGKALELFSERRLMSADVSRLPLAHHVDHLDATQHSTGAIHGLEPHHRANPPLDSPVILFDSVVETTTLPDPDRLELPSGSVPEPVCRVAA
jgi:hypothetical protein